MDSAAKIVAELRRATLAGSEQKADATPSRNVPAPQPLGNPGLIYPHQQDVFESLRASAHAFGKENWWALPVIPRWHVLLIGATGTGKSHLVHALGKSLNWPVYSVFATRWVIAGGRGKETWTEIAKWLSKQEGKCIIFIDEIEKVHGDDTWSRHLLTEFLQILDRNLPREIDIDDSDSEQSKPGLWAKAKKVLMCDTLILAAGAFQSLWDHRPKALGFGEQSAVRNTPSQQELKSVLPAELINRFGKILHLPPLSEKDYVAMIRRTATALPGEIRDKFIKSAEKHLAVAIRDGLGARFIEECVTTALLHDAEGQPPQKAEASRRRSISP